LRLVIDTDSNELQVTDGGTSETLPLYSRAAFEHISRQWIRVGWDQKYSYTFSWLGRPVIQLPEDLVRIQEVIHELQPDVIVETGVAHGGSLIFYASLFQGMGKGRVVGVDIEIRPANREAIEAHPLSSYITLIEGSSTAPATLDAVRAQIRPGERVLVILDSDHSRKHVTDELNAYAPLVTSGSYIVATDGLMEDLHDVPRGAARWAEDNPSAAAREFAAEHPEFLLQQPAWPFNESTLRRNITHWPDAWLRRLS
jgi:cephalosporin hydroxylase